MLVYCVTNLVDGKKYVGQTTRELDARWKEHVHSARQPSRGKQCPRLYAAMNKHGVHNFSISEIDRADDASCLDDIEELWIAKLGTTDRNRGYNISFGGASRPNPETRAKLSASLKGKPAWNKGQPMSKDHYNNVLRSGVWGENKPPISDSGKKRLRETKLGSINPNFGGKSMTDETRKLMREAHVGKGVGEENPMFRKDISDEVILQLRSIGFTQKRIGELVSCSQKTIGNRLRGYPEYV